MAEAAIEIFSDSSQLQEVVFFEFQTKIEIAKQLHYLDEQQFYSLNKKTQELEVMLNAFGKKLKESFKS